MFKPKVISVSAEHPRFLRDGKNLEWTVGNITLDSSKLEEGQVIKNGTAVFQNKETDLYELVEEDTPETMAAPVITGRDVTVESKDINTLVSGLRKGSVYEEAITGLTDNFKKATQGRITYDV